MRRTKQWWTILTAAERSELCWLERCNSVWATHGRSANLPDDCSECLNCSTPHTGIGLCPACNQRLNALIYKADYAIKDKAKK